ncbi:STAS domain-containing protein [Streptomyces sp. NPDC046685]|uniref:STAS domain-containing protein n=1 Tax=Streptomyces sp. NPDC046685 TaxID=3157202 RepID=UPI0033CFD526
MDTTAGLGFSWRHTPSVLTGGVVLYDSFQVVVQPTGPGICRVTVAGELDVVSAPDIRDTLRVALAGHDRVDVNCAGVTFVDCSGLSALLAAARAAKAGGTEMRLSAVPHSLARLLRLTHADRAFIIEPDAR